MSNHSLMKVTRSEKMKALLMDPFFVTREVTKRGFLTIFPSFQVGGI